MNHIINKDFLTKSDAVELLNISTKSPEFYALIEKSNALSRKEFENKGYIFAQIGINSSKCSGNCKFCSLAKDGYSVDTETEKTLEDIKEQAKYITSHNIAALFLMTTADYDKNKFLTICTEVKKVIPSDVALVANIGDFDLPFAQRMKDAGVTGVYHIVRINEGIDTDISAEDRIATLDSIRDAGLELYYCVEPIGPEHTYEQIADEMLRARDYNVRYMAVMRRVGVPGTKYHAIGDITELELTKIAAVTNLVTRPAVSMNVHEPMMMPLLGGVNQLYAEFGMNPRDTEINTVRGFDIERTSKMLKEAEWII